VNSEARIVIEPISNLDHGGVSLLPSLRLSLVVDYLYEDHMRYESKEVTNESSIIRTSSSKMQNEFV
jgi:hypothetical protein